MTAQTYDQYSDDGGASVRAVRVFTWYMVALTFVYLLNNYLIFWQGWPGLWTLGEALIGGEKAPTLDGTALTLGFVQVGLYAACLVWAVAYVARNTERTLRADSECMDLIVRYFIRACFWAVVLVGLADAIISFLRVEGLLEVTVGEAMATELGRSQFRGPYIHMPLIALSFVIAFFTRTVGFTWLALLVVVAELLIVVSRFIFSYEQAFQGDLVRFWYGSLFLFASAHTLLEDGHVRVDVLYSGFSSRLRGWVNLWGSLLLGAPLCWCVLVLGMWSKSTIINSPILAYEVTQQGFGMYVKYLMAAFLAVFAVSMMIQFMSYVLWSLADIRGEPGGRETDNTITH